ncbi:MAG: hypothetical protein ACXWP6_02775 [Ktedonobacterales bacterium]
MRLIRFRHGDAYTPEQVVEMQERLAALEQLSTDQQHQLADQQTEMLQLRAILLAVGRTLPDLADLPTVPALPAVRPQAASAPAPAANAANVQADSEQAPHTAHPQQEAGARPDTPIHTSRRALLKWGGAAAAAGVAATAANVLREAPTARAAGTAWQTGNVTADAETIVTPANNYPDNDILQLQQGSGIPFQPAQLKTALAAYDTTGNNIGVYGTSSGGTGLYGVTDTGTAAQGQAGLYAKAASTGTGVAGASGSGIGVQGNSNTGIGGSFTGGQAPLALGLGAAGAPTSGTHIAGEIYADASAALYVCVQGGTPGVWKKIAWAGSLNGGQVSLLPAPIRVLDTRPSLWGANTTHPVQVTGVIVGGISVPGGAIAMIGNVTVTETTGSGHLRLYPQGAPLPNTSSINYVAGQTVANGVTVGLSSTGKISIFVSNGGAKVILDVAGYAM